MDLKDKIEQQNSENLDFNKNKIKEILETQQDLTDPEKYKNHKAGFVNIIGNPNVGKSTLMNNMVGEQLSIITHKAQTTRHRIFGIVNGDNFQIIYSDTPGILKPFNKLQEAMLKYVDTALEDADIILYVTDVNETPDKNKEYLDKIRLISQKIPLILVINKIDLVDQAKVQSLIDQWKEIFPNAEIVPASALHKFNLDKIFNLILEKLPYSPPYFDKEQLTDKPLRFFIAEIIRQKIFELFRQEVPYSTEVIVEEFKELPNITRIRAIIYVAKESQKPIIIGKGGQAIKKLGIAARQAIEEFLGRHIYLDLYVKVAKNWRNDLSRLKQFGYEL
jgi:GTP-binding protein Era